MGIPCTFLCILVTAIIVFVFWLEPSLASTEESFDYFGYNSSEIFEPIQLPSCPQVQLEKLTETWEGHNATLYRGPSLPANVLVYIDKEYYYCRIAWIFEFASPVWKYMKETYGDFGTSQQLLIVLHEQRYPGSRHVHSQGNQPTILDLGHVVYQYWVNPSSQKEAQTVIAHKLAYFIEMYSNNRVGYNNWKHPNSKDTAWANIFTYDVYKTANISSFSVGSQSDAELYKEQLKLKSYDFPRKGTFWLRDWFLPIYETYGENLVLIRYFLYLQEFLPTGVQNLTIGELVHFWSAAAESDLVPLANATFGWNNTFEKELARARIQYDKVALLYNYNNEQNQNSLIIGGSVSISMFLVICALAAFVVHYKRKVRILKTEIRALTNKEVKDFFEGDSNVSNSNAELQTHIQSLPFVKDFEISRDQLILGRESFIGSGEYGCVMRGFLSQLDSGDLLPVAVKTVKPDVEVPYFKAMLSEAKVMAYLGKHDNIVLLCGTYTANIKNREIYIALELCALGDLQKYLKVHGKDFRNSFPAQEEERHPIIEKNDVNSTEEFTTSSLLKWSHNISSAMMYLTEKRVIHGDLAARNVLLTANRVAKVSDFGLSRQLLNYDNYLKTSKTPLPWRWMAVESLKDMEFSVASDAWAFGVTLWEIFALGETPYPGWTWDLGFVDRLVGGDRLQKPFNADNTIFQVMMDCWKLEPSERPSFETICNILNEALQTTGNVERNYIDLSSMQIDEIV